MLSTMKWLRGWRGLLDRLGDRLVTGSIRWIRVHDSWVAILGHFHLRSSRIVEHLDEADEAESPCLLIPEVLYQLEL